MQRRLPLHYVAVSPLAHRKRLSNPKTKQTKMKNFQQTLQATRLVEGPTS
jgi:hypothetical protein